ncbi:MAG: sulfotransferase [Candidatus Thermoplasmatota archaeon]
MDRNQETRYLEELKHVNFHPVFILGVHRSGTSILYKMLTATGCFIPVTAYHLINYHELLSNFHENKEHLVKQQLTDSLLKNGLADRGIDRLKITADFAEEYGFLLGTKTIQMRITKSNIALFTELCKKIQFIAGSDKPILLKNPYDFPNFLYIKEKFPNARFVFIHRHPLKTISSTLYAIRTLLQEKNPYTTRLSRVYEQCYTNPLLLQPLRFIFQELPECCVVALSRITKKATGYYLKSIEKLPKNDFVSITYEDLCAHPQDTLHNLMEALSLTTTQKIDAASLISPRKVDVDPSVLTLRSSIYKSMRTYFDRFQYSSEE